MAGVPEAVSLSISVSLALLFATVVQMVLGELAPKNLAIAKPEALAKALSRSTLIYLAVAGPLIRLFDATSNRLLRGVGIEPVEELPQGATAEDLDRIIETSRERGAARRGHRPGCSIAAWTFATRTAGEAMVPRVDVVTVAGDGPGGTGGGAARHRPHPVPGDRGGRRRRVGIVSIARGASTWTRATAAHDAGAAARAPRRVLRAGVAAAAAGAGAAAGRAPAAGLCGRRVRRVRRDHHPGGHRRGTGRRHPRRGRPARAGRRHRDRRLVARCPAGGAWTRSPTRPASSCPTATSTTPSPGWCCAGSAGWPTSGDEVIGRPCADALDADGKPVPDRPGHGCGSRQVRRRVPHAVRTVDRLRREGHR